MSNLFLLPVNTIQDTCRQIKLDDEISEAPLGSLADTNERTKMKPSSDFSCKVHTRFSRTMTNDDCVYLKSPVNNNTLDDDSMPLVKFDNNPSDSPLQTPLNHIPMAPHSMYYWPKDHLFHTKYSYYPNNKLPIGSKIENDTFSTRSWELKQQFKQINNYYNRSTGHNCPCG